tara:strand:- start:229 stop:432 length:204 start_codon:yes stop_codon:yes gene_type:complete
VVVAVVQVRLEEVLEVLVVVVEHMDCQEQHLVVLEQVVKVMLAALMEVILETHILLVAAAVLVQQDK